VLPGEASGGFDDILIQLGAYVLTVILALAIQQFIVYSASVAWLGGMHPFTFFRGVREAMLTAFSTAVMVRFGRTYSNLMVSMRATNAKLRGRTLRILREATGAGAQDCAEALAAADGDLKVALVQLLSGVDTGRAATALTGAQGYVRGALYALDPLGRMAKPPTLGG